MNLRILKKLSKKAVPLLGHFGIDPSDLFLAVKWEDHTGLLIRDRTCWTRNRSAHDQTWGGEIKRPARDGKGWVCLRPPNAPLKGTPMVRRMSGGEEPEWDSRTALEELIECVRWSDRPATMTAADWAPALRIAQTKPITRDEIDDMLNDMGDASAWDFDSTEEGLTL